MASTFDRKAAAWVRRKFPGMHPEEGSVSFDMWTSLADESEVRIDVSFTDVTDYGLTGLPPGRNSRRRDLDGYDLDKLISEILETEVPSG